MFSRSRHPPPRLYTWQPIRPFSYAEFVNISKEISNLENEMLELKESLVEWKNMPSLLHIDDSASVPSIWAFIKTLEVNQLTHMLRSTTQRAFISRRPARHLR